jgi:uncharacterized protein
MIRHLTKGDFKTMPWANGKGVTVEMARVDDAQGMLWRLSRAAVVEDGDFSIFPGVDRNLTVISGPGFDLRGARSLRADPLQPVAFPGDVALAARGVTAPCEDFNVMTRRGAMRAEVALAEGGQLDGGLCAVLALGAVRAAGLVLAPLDLLLADEATGFTGRALLVRLTRG